MKKHSNKALRVAIKLKVVPKLAIVVPCYNEQEIIETTYHTLNAKLQRLIDSCLIQEDSFCIFVDDGSKDSTWSILERLISPQTPTNQTLTKEQAHKIQNLHTQTKAHDDENNYFGVYSLGYNDSFNFDSNSYSPPPKRVKSNNNIIESKPISNVALKLCANRGHQNALLAGLDFAYQRCDCVISIDGDLQQDEEKIDEFIQKFVSGADIVFGIRNDRATDSVFKKYTALGFYKIMHLMGIEIIKNHADYRLLSQKALQSLRQYNESNLFLRGIIAQMGLKQDKVYFDVKQRLAGTSKYSLKKMLSFAWNGITSFSITPLRIVSVLGVLFFMVSACFGGYVLFIKIFTTKAIYGWASTLILMCFFSGVQLLSLGIMGEYIGKIYLESKKRPRYFIEEVISDSRS
ncbi:Uncharacterized glycosyltransferase ykoT [Helicobacter fennelliae]|uniref:Uncharacterized glycosyltransferase ykoT n=1 Tax=Helicobacter fennelliae TaxID=215 RepID=A0A2X3B6H5_9HELI|nr:glycosyltransferase family 2 protein [Helicobacter fennelliae]SQB97317.1 Uncharacterized glycosyltransferase ykoT [Helicobacter fennelliae]